MIWSFFIFIFQPNNESNILIKIHSNLSIHDGRLGLVHCVMTLAISPWLKIFTFCFCILAEIFHTYTCPPIRIRALEMKTLVFPFRFFKLVAPCCIKVGRWDSFERPRHVGLNESDLFKYFCGTVHFLSNSNSFLNLN